MMERFDVAIVGAGPAGCRAAWRLARAGMHVALFDGSHPREKPCGGGVTGRALDLVRDAIDTSSLSTVTIEDITFEHRSRLANVRLTGGTGATPQLSVVPRAQFDGALLEAAIDSGAVLVRERVRDLAAETNDWRISTVAGSTRASWVL